MRGPDGVAQEDQGQAVIMVAQSHLRRRATSFSAHCRYVLSGAPQPTALIGSLQLRVLPALCPRLLRLIWRPAASKRHEVARSYLLSRL